MRNPVLMLALVAGIAAGSSGIALAQDPVSAAIGTAGAVAGAAVGTAGAVAGTAVGVAAGTAGAVVGVYPYGPGGPRCPHGYRYYSGACYMR